MSLRRALAALAAAVLVVPLLPAASLAAEVTPRPASGTLTLEGRGYGHGRGLSQWGAYGAANRGLTWQQILDFYYPGTTRSTVRDTPIRVWISTDSDNEVRVDPAPGLAITSGGARTELPTGAAYDGWRIIRVGGTPTLQRLDGSTWYAHPLPSALAAGAEFSAGSTLLRLVLPNGNRQEMRGTVTAVPDGTALRTVAVMPMESYLRGVVPAEMPASWLPDAVRAQAVAARTYAARLRAGATAKLWDTCDTTACQVFSGTATYRADGTLVTRREHPASDAAIAATAGTVLTFNGGQLVLTEFSASNGGWTAAGPAAHPYQVAKPDPYDGRMSSTAHRWTARVAVSGLERAYPAIGTLRQISVDRRNGLGDLGGRVLQMTVSGSRGSVRITGDDARRALGLKSNWFQVTDLAAFPRDFSGDGAADLLAARDDGGFWLYSGDGAGGFSGSRKIGHGWYTRNLIAQVGDWDGDRAQDVLARDPVTGNLWLYRGDGAGGFGRQGSIGGKWWSVDTMLGVGDWNGDGHEDVVARLSADASLWLYPGNGRGGWLTPRQIGRGWSGLDLLTAVGDVTGDGAPDLVARVRSTGALTLYPGTGTGGFGTVRDLGRGWGQLTALVGPGDWDGDGLGDLIGRVPSGDLLLYRGTSDGGFGTGTTVGRGWNPFRLVG